MTAGVIGCDFDCPPRAYSVLLKTRAARTVFAGDNVTISIYPATYDNRYFIQNWRAIVSPYTCRTRLRTRRRPMRSVRLKKKNATVVFCCGTRRCLQFVRVVVAEIGTNVFFKSAASARRRTTLKIMILKPAWRPKISRDFSVRSKTLCIFLMTYTM